VRLTDVAPDGPSEWITDGYLRASMRRYEPARSIYDGSRLVRAWRPYDALQPVLSSDPVEYVVQLQDSSNVFRAGHRLRFDVLPVASSGFGTSDVPGAGAITLLHDAAHPSSLQLPVIPARCQDAVPMLPTGTPLDRCASSYAEAAG